MDELLNKFFNIPICIQVAPFLLQGLLNTLLLSALVIPFGLIAGLLVGVLSITLKNRWARGILAVSIDVFRAGLESVPSGQIQAARSTGLSATQTLLYIQIPQATRNVMPDLISNTIEVIKLTTLASAVAMPELLRVARDAQSLVYNPSPIVLAAIFYLVLLWPLVLLLSRFEHKKMGGEH